MRDHQNNPHTDIPTATDANPQAEQRRAFVDPELRRHESLPKVTTGFVGTFVP